MRGDVRLCQFPYPDKLRPVVVLTDSVLLGHLASATVAPITSTIRDVPSEVRLTEADGMKGPCAVNLHNIVTLPKTALGRKIGTLSDERLHEICGALAFALGCVQ